MKKSNDPRPPQWATRLLSWYCKPALLEDLQGDLNEYFERNVRSKGAFQARLIYVVDVIKFIRPYTVERPGLFNILIHWVMLGNYIKTSRRSIVRNKLFSIINVAGLAISMCVGLVMIAMMTDLLSYDKFHANYDRIYRVICRYEFNGNTDHIFMATTSPKAARAIRDDFAGVEQVAVFRRGFGGDVTFEETTIPLSGLWADRGVFDMFSFELLAGDRRTVLRTPFTVVLTEKSALKLFGETNVVGKVIRLHRGKPEERAYTVAGVLKDLPTFSHLQFDMLGSLSSHEALADSEAEMAWDNVWHTWTYVLLSEGADPNLLRRNLSALSAKEDKSVAYTHIEFAIQPLGEIILGDGPDGRRIGNEIGGAMGGTVTKVLGALSFIVILSAALNYTNLSVARSFRRTREVGVRKTIGAQRMHVINQFLVESVIISLIALVAAFGLFLLIRPYFLSMEESLGRLLRLDISPLLMAEFSLFAVVVGIVAGLFPALYFARVNAVQVFRNAVSIPAMKGLTMRKVLITFQYCISIIGITATLIIYKQYKHFVTFDLGFTTENVLNIRLQGNNPEILKNKLLQLHEVKAVSRSILVTSVGSFWGTTVKNPDIPLDSAGVGYNGVDEHYLTLHDHQFITGRNFTPKPDGSVENEVIVNQQTLKRFNIAGGDPIKAVGEILQVDGKPMTIIGVIKDFQYGKANDRMRSEVVMRYMPKDAQYLNVKVSSTDWLETMAKIESAWKEVDGVHALDARFYADDIEAAFQGMEASAKVGSFLAFLVLCIASIGLLGMVVYSTETRMREVCIRKVFGAGEMRLLIILSSGFIWLLALAVFIALPLTYLFFDRIVLPGIANHAPMGLFELTAGVALVMSVALLMIMMQTLKVAKVNPAQVLKGE